MIKKLRFIFAAILAIALLVTSVVPSVAYDSKPRTPRNIKGTSLNEAETKVNSDKKLDSLRNNNVEPDTQVPVIVVFEGDAAVKSQGQDINSKAAQAYRSNLKRKQDNFFEQLNFEATLKYNYTVLLNGIAITTAYQNVQVLSQLKGVEGVYIANSYEAPTEMPEMEFANAMSGAAELHNRGCNGDGIVVAVLDTGLTTGHEAFRDYGLTENPALNRAEVQNIDTNKAGAFLSSKVPFAYDYYDNVNDVSDSNGHGTHVSGSAVGYVESTDGAVTFSGAAPAAQLLSMKVFSSDESQAGTSSDIYFAALEDAYLLGADVINMSLGSPNGFTHDAELEDAVYSDLYRPWRIQVLSCAFLLAMKPAWVIML